MTGQLRTRKSLSSLSARLNSWICQHKFFYHPTIIFLCAHIKFPLRVSADGQSGNLIFSEPWFGQCCVSKNITQSLTIIIIYININARVCIMPWMERRKASRERLCALARLENEGARCVAATPTAGRRLSQKLNAALASPIGTAKFSKCIYAQRTSAICRAPQIRQFRPGRGAQSYSFGINFLYLYQLN